MKYPLTKHKCMNEDCGWNETNHKVWDGIKCPECDGIVFQTIVKDKTNKDSNSS